METIIFDSYKGRHFLKMCFILLYQFLFFSVPFYKVPINWSLDGCIEIFLSKLGTDALNLVSLPVPDDPPSRLSSWVVPPNPKAMGEVTHLPGEMLMAQLQSGTETGSWFQLGAEAEKEPESRLTLQ